MVFLNPSQLRIAQELADRLTAYKQLLAKANLGNADAMQAGMLGDAILMRGQELADHLRGGYRSIQEYNQTHR